MAAAIPQAPRRSRTCSPVTARLGASAHPAYLDLAEPDLSHGRRRPRHRRPSPAVVVPLLFTAAFHATIDEPRRRYAALRPIRGRAVMADILGTGDDVVELLRACMAEAGVGPERSVLLFAVGSSTPAANEAVADLADRLAADRGGAGTGGVRHLRPARRKRCVAELDEPIAIVPLFLARRPAARPGPYARRRARLDHDLSHSAERAAGIVLARYRSALGRSALARYSIGFDPWPSPRRTPAGSYPPTAAVRGLRREDRRVRRRAR